MTNRIREPINSLTHLIGAGVFLILTVLMYTKAFLVGPTVRNIVSVTAFGLGLIALYSTSGWYHLILGSEERIKFWKKMDHTMIFILIAGTYTAFCLLGLPSNIGIPLLIAVWSIAIVGSLMMIFWIGMPRWLNTLLYIALGWIGITCAVPLYFNLPRPAFILLLLGGVFYTIGGVIYGIKKPNISKEFGFHELFHIFCLLGSACHFIDVYFYLL